MASINSGVTFDDSCVSICPTNCRRMEIEFAEFEWMSMKKRIAGLVKKVSISSIRCIADEILEENLISGRGLFCQAIMKTQMKFPKFSNMYAALVAIINFEFPDVGLLLVKRVVVQFKEAYNCGNKKLMGDSLKFLAHLVNQTVVYEVVALDILMFLLGNPSLDNIEIAACFCTQCGSFLQSCVPHKMEEVLQEFLLVHRRLNFKKYPSIADGFDLVEVDDQVTHVVSLLHDIDPEYNLDNFEVNMELLQNDRGDEQHMLPCDEDSEIDEVTSDGPFLWNN